MTQDKQLSPLEKNPSGKSMDRDSAWGSDTWKGLALFIAFIVFTLICFGTGAKEKKDSYQMTYDHGKYSRQHDVSSEANPWSGNRGTAWLNGWAEGKDQ